ncbi:MAG: radical SAM protein [Kiritimatiellia bacterium]|jgi:pyruvate formate lyase activating enzyme|nr:radical SAM protein [Kiritimatiellia bacterium]
MEGVIFDIKRFAVHDGPGIRTTVFLKGCPLSCSWCHNPESQGAGIETLDGPGGSIVVGRAITVDEVVTEVERDTVFFDESGGGVTFSGGEPLAQHEFLLTALERCGDLDIHRAVDTCGHAPREVLLKVAELADLVLYDLKIADNAGHSEHTGVDTVTIQENLGALCDTGVAMEIRIPVVPEITTVPGNLDALGAVVKSLTRPIPVRLLPYHSAAMDKYPRFGFTPPLPDTPEPTEDEMDGFRTTLRNTGLEVKE